MPTYTLDENTIKTAKNTKRLKVKSISSILSKKNIILLGTTKIFCQKN